MRALLSVYDKTGIVEFALALHVLGVELVSSGGTAKAIADAGIPVTDVAEFTGYPAMLGHRVVTLHPKVHGGILADRNDPEHQADLLTFDISTIDIVGGNLYPFDSEPSVELIDIGGPALLRAAAKNFAHVLSVVDPADYENVLRAVRAALSAEEGITGTHYGEYLARELARKAFAHTAAYDAQIVQWFDAAVLNMEGPPPTLHLAAELNSVFKYGENALQQAAEYDNGSSDALSLPRFRTIEGRPGFNNALDVHRALQTLTHIVAGWEKNFGQSDQAIAVGMKHGNACGAALDVDPVAAIRGMLVGNLTSIFGGYVMTNFVITEEVARELLHYAMPGEQRRLLDGVVAPYFTDEAVALLHRKDDRCVMIVNPVLDELTTDSLDLAPRLVPVRGATLWQENYRFVLDLGHPEIESTSPLSQKERENVVLGWAVGATSNSNTTVLARDRRLFSSGVGQMDRVGASKLAIQRFKDARDGMRVAGLSWNTLQGSAGYTDSFFPFPDGGLVLARSDVRTIFASRGSVKDGEVRAALEKQGVNFVTLPDAICRGFYGHS